MGTEIDPRGRSLRISEDLFRLTTESLRLHSNMALVHKTLADLVDHRVLGGDTLSAHDPATLGEHLDVVPGRGDIDCVLPVSAQSLDYLERLQATFSQVIGRGLSLEDALSLLLFDYVVDQKAVKVLQILKVEQAHRQPSYGGTSRHYARLERPDYC